MLSKSQERWLLRWLGFSRTRLFTAVTVPSLVGAAIAFADGFFPVIRFILIILGMILAESANLLLADWTEFKKIDISRGKVKPMPPLAGSPMLPTSLLPLRYSIHASIVAALFAMITLIYFVLLAGAPVLILFGIAVITGIFYAAPPFRYAFFSTAILPPVVAFGVYFIMSGMPGWVAGLSALPVFFSSVGAIYTYRVLYQSKDSINFERKRNYLTIIFALCDLTLLALVLFRVMPWWTLLGLLGLPLVWVTHKVTGVEKKDYLPTTSLGVLKHSVTGIMIAAGFLIHVLTLAQ